MRNVKSETVKKMLKKRRARRIRKFRNLLIFALILCGGYWGYKNFDKITNYLIKKEKVVVKAEIEEKIKEKIEPIIEIPTKKGIYIYRETEDYNEIKPSFEIVRDEKCSNGKYLTQRMDNGCLGHGQGSAIYNMEITEDNDYAFWSLVNWESGCSNLFILDVENSIGEKILPYRQEKKIALYSQTKWRPTYIGKDNSFNNWHWIGNHIFKLKKGLYKFKLSVGLNGSSMDKFLLTTNLKDKPNNNNKIINTNTCFYCAGPLPYEELHGHWERKKGVLFCVNNGLIVTGESWWTNYQITLLCSVPAEGQGGSVFCYKDDENYYYLALSKKLQTLYKIKDGVRTILAQTEKALLEVQKTPVKDKVNEEQNKIKEYTEKITEYKKQVAEYKKKEEWAKLFPTQEKMFALERALDKLKNKEIKKNKNQLILKEKQSTKLKSKKDKVYLPERVSNRITINKFNNIIQVFLDGKKIMELIDSTFSSGKAGFLTENAITFAIDDMQISSINEFHRFDKNEYIPKFNVKTRIINSVMDNVAAMGWKHPGEHSENRSEEILQKFLEKNFNIKSDKICSILDFQWLNFERNVFKEKNGNGIKKGFIEFNANDEKRHLLFSNMTLSKDWTFQYQIQGDVEEFGLCLKDDFDYKFICDYYNLICSIKENKVYFETKNETKSQKLEIEWKKNEIYDIKYKKKGSNIDFFINNQKVYKYYNINADLFRPAIIITKGQGFIDNIESYTTPNLFYDFSYNKSWSFTLSDFDTIYNLRHHGGYYYSYISLKDFENKDDIEPSITTKRMFKGNFSILLNIENKSNKYFDIVLKNILNNKTCSFKLTANEISYYENEKKKEFEPLSGFNGYNRLLVFVRLIVENGIARIYTTDTLGSQRLIMKTIVNMNQNDVFKLQLKAKPKLEIKHILIWGEEVYKEE